MVTNKDKKTKKDETKESGSVAKLWSYTKAKLAGESSEPEPVVAEPATPKQEDNTPVVIKNTLIDPDTGEEYILKALVPTAVLKGSAGLKFNGVDYLKLETMRKEINNQEEHYVRIINELRVNQTANHTVKEWNDLELKVTELDPKVGRLTADRDAADKNFGELIAFQNEMDNDYEQMKAEVIAAAEDLKLVTARVPKLERALGEQKQYIELLEIDQPTIKNLNEELTKTELDFVNYRKQAAIDYQKIKSELTAVTNASTLKDEAIEATNEKYAKIQENYGILEDRALKLSDKLLEQTPVIPVIRVPRVAEAGPAQAGLAEEVNVEWVPAAELTVKSHFGELITNYDPNNNARYISDHAQLVSEGKLRGDRMIHFVTADRNLGVTAHKQYQKILASVNAGAGANGNGH